MMSSSSTATTEIGLRTLSGTHVTRTENKMKTRFQIISVLVLASFMTNARAQELSIPDTDLNAAIRAALAKPAEPLNVQDLLNLTNLNASFRSVRSLEGLGAAQNLTTLDLSVNQLTSLTLPARPTLTSAAI